ncbi:VanW family protein [Ferdinandcohnia quinoae]|uniref:VanW family protein n=1 Tax=Fredinandcohnia quinoae TaxID=2918902 RepID=A0AAW5E6B2_9BACI|nr:VanW family protein [Fredinandcohnia sp. SECRCQ15]MCH1624309.1 VanW family protein [Fredinandcohnia sp. SECRCQ15]
MKSVLLTFLLLSVSQLQPQENLVITYEGQPIATADRESYSSPLTGVPIINKKKYTQFIDYLDEQIYKDPVNAKIGNSGGIIQEQVGIKLNRNKFMQIFYTYLFSKGDLTIEVPVQYIYPKVDSELLSSIRTTKIGQYVTYFNSNNEARSTNISLSTSAINNYVILPNETFSFNKVVGKRTTAKGYLAAPEIVKGELIEGIGGGICQVSSTLFNAVDRAGVEIIKRYSHSKRVPYVPPGRDATVSWYGPDFTFKNSYNQPILIRAKTIGGSLIISVYSSEDINYKPRKISINN